MPNFAVSVLQGHPTLVSVLLAFIIGVAIGSILCARVSGSRWSRADSLGGIGLTISSTDIFFSAAFQLANPASQVLPLVFFTLDGALRVFIDLVAIGWAGIIALVFPPLVQSRTASHKRARVIAASNVFNALFMVSGAILGIVCLSIVQMSIPSSF